MTESLDPSRQGNKKIIVADLTSIDHNNCSISSNLKMIYAFAGKSASKPKAGLGFFL
jgi:hypothetical protein